MKLELIVRGTKQQRVITLKKDSIFSDVEVGDVLEVEKKGEKFIMTKKVRNDNK